MLMTLCFKLAGRILKGKFFTEVIYYRFRGALALQSNSML